MKKALLLICLSAICFLSRAQLPYLGNYTVIPQNPTPADFIKIAVKATTPNQGILVDINHTVTAFQIRLTTCYWQGMATATQTYVDTFMVGLLPPGNYTILQKAYMSTTQQWCNKTDSNTISGSLQITGTTAIEKRQWDESFRIYPNPAAREFFISGNFKSIDLSIFSADGALVRKTNLLNGKAATIDDLPDGLYFVSARAGDQIYQRKIIKKNVE